MNRSIFLILLGDDFEIIMIQILLSSIDIECTHEFQRIFIFLSLYTYRSEWAIRTESYRTVHSALDSNIPPVRYGTIYFASGI